LAYPGGPAIDRAARDGNPRAIHFPRPLLDDPGRLDFSFSGLKTAVRYHISKPGCSDGHPVRLERHEICHIAASFQAAVVDCLVGKAELACQQTGLKTLCVGGGVAANSRLRHVLAESAKQHAYRLHIAPLALCTDNAVMGAIAVERFRAGRFESLELDVEPGMVRQFIGPLAP
jgi:N6-L-threonylcarbamoyladenine synthase